MKFDDNTDELFLQIYSIPIIDHSNLSKTVHTTVLYGRQYISLTSLHDYEEKFPILQTQEDDEPLFFLKSIEIRLQVANFAARATTELELNWPVY